LPKLTSRYFNPEPVVVHCGAAGVLVFFEVTVEAVFVDAGWNAAGVEAAGTLDLEALVFEFPVLPVGEKPEFGAPVLAALGLVVVGELA
jgi:hypothetical protein